MYSSDCTTADNLCAGTTYKVADCVFHRGKHPSDWSDVNKLCQSQDQCIMPDQGTSVFQLKELPTERGWKKIVQHFISFYPTSL